MKKFASHPVTIVVAILLAIAAIIGAARQYDRKYPAPYISDQYIANTGATCPHCGKRLDQPPVK